MSSSCTGWERSCWSVAGTRDSRGQPVQRHLSLPQRAPELHGRDSAPAPSVSPGGRALPVPRLGDKPAAGLHLHIQAPLHAAHFHVFVQVPVHVVLSCGQLQLQWGGKVARLAGQGPEQQCLHSPNLDAKQTLSVQARPRSLGSKFRLNKNSKADNCGSQQKSRILGG